MVNFRKLFFAALISLLFFHEAKSQVPLGFANSNYSVVEASMLNPAAGVDPLPFLDMTFLGAHGFLHSNYAYLPKSEFNPILLKRGTEFQYSQSTNKKHLQANANVMGVSFNYPIGKLTIGMNTGIRNLISVRNLPANLAEQVANDWQTEDIIGKKYEGSNFRVNVISYEEIGVNIGAIAYQKEYEMVNVAVRPKILTGAGGYYLHAQSFNYAIIDTQNVEFSNINATYGGTETGFGRGLGVGVDLGVQYKFMTKSVGNYTPHSFQNQCEKIPYKLKIGFSILDLGLINFNKSSYFRRINNGSVLWTDFKGLSTDNAKTFIDQMDERFSDDLTEETTGYIAYLPTSVSAQFDYNMENGWYLNGMAFYSFRRKVNFGGELLSYVAFTPRYEKKYFGFYAPVSINRFLIPNAGVAFRLGPLQFGTDNIIPYFIGDAYRLDVYASLKIRFHDSKRCIVAKGEPDWRVRDCSGPKRDPRSSKYKKKKNKKRYKRNLKRQRKYGIKK